MKLSRAILEHLDRESSGLRAEEIADACGENIGPIAALLHNLGARCFACHLLDGTDRWIITAAGIEWLQSQEPEWAPLAPRVTACRIIHEQAPPAPADDDERPRRSRRVPKAAILNAALAEHGASDALTRPLRPNGKHARLGIDTDIPVPQITRGTGNYIEIARHMEPGDSKFVASASAAGSLISAMARLGYKSLRRKVEGGFRVWRKA